MNEKQRLQEIKRNRNRRIRKERDFVRKEFETVCKEFFPRWKGREKYRVKLTYYLHHLGSKGECDYDEKTISIKSEGFLRDDLKKLVSLYGHKIFGTRIRLTPKQALDNLLIHEICHAVIHWGLPHGKRWRDRMLVASNRARALGRKKLAESIRNGAKIHRYLESHEKEEREFQRRIRRQIRETKRKVKGGEKDA